MVSYPHLSDREEYITLEQATHIETYKGESVFKITKVSNYTVCIIQHSFPGNEPFENCIDRDFFEEWKNTSKGKYIRR